MGCISTTINSRDLKFGRFIKDNECSNFVLYHVNRSGSRDQKLGQSLKTQIWIETRKIMQLEKPDGVSNDLELILQRELPFIFRYL